MIRTQCNYYMICGPANKTKDKGRWAWPGVCVFFNYFSVSKDCEKIIGRYIPLKHAYSRMVGDKNRFAFHQFPYPGNRVIC